MRNKPFTTSEFFNTICNILKEKEEYPTILDYALPTRKEFPIPNEEFRLESHLAYGGSEGIYLDLYLRREDEEHLKSHFSEEDDKAYPLGTFKTIEDNQDAMRTMGILLADFLVESRAYVNQHLEDFNWLGYDVYISDEEGRNIEQWKYTCSTVQRALDKKEILLEDHEFVTIVSNADKVKQTYSAPSRPMTR